ncbi:MAG: FkbM family methyltransferase [Alphaproteobacteria bacterium]
MPFVSHAQNLEDVMLWRALNHVGHGRYVDVGAQHPVIESVSKAFYDHGWRGVHVEPTPEHAELLRRDRPDETVLQIALGSHDGTLDLNVIPGTGLSTAIDVYANRHKAERGFDGHRVQVPMMTLKSALAFLAGQEVHWLKIDVEGLEGEVLKGWDSNILRPWVMVIEATVPGSLDARHEDWEPMLIAAGYRFVYFDGLNRFYIAKEHGELAAAFSSPPSIVDAVKYRFGAATVARMLKLQYWHWPLQRLRKSGRTAVPRTKY